MLWTDEIIEWCGGTRQNAVQRLQAFEAGKCKLFDGDADVSREAMLQYGDTIAEMDRMIVRIRENRAN